MQELNLSLSAVQADGLPIGPQDIGTAQGQSVIVLHLVIPGLKKKKNNKNHCIGGVSERALTCELMFAIQNIIYVFSCMLTTAWDGN